MDTGNFHWEDEGGQYRAVDKNGTPLNRFMPYKQWQEMTQRAAAGAIDGGGAVPKGFSTQAVEDGKAAWSKLQGTARTGAKAAAWRELKSAGMWFTQSLKAAPLLTKLSAISLGATAFDLGWKIGGGEDSVWGFVFGGNEEEAEVEPPGARVFHAERLIPVGFEDDVCFGGTFYEGCPLAAPSPGFTARFENSVGTEAKIVETTSRSSLTGGECEDLTFWGYDTLGASLLSVGSDGGNVEGCGEWVGAGAVVFVPPDVACIAGQTTEGCPGKEYDSVKETGSEAPLEGTEAGEAAGECFTGAAPCGELPAWWYNNDPAAQEDATGEDEVDDPLAIVIPEPLPSEPYEEYGETLEELELVPEYIELPLEDVDTEREKGTVIITKPTWGTGVDPESTVQVKYNPDYRVVPSINPGETYEEYAARIEEETGLKPQKVPLPEVAIDPETGPEGASYTSPSAGSVVAPGSTVNVQTNPATAPYPDTGGGWSALAIVPIDPPSALAGACDVFPFGVLCWAAASIEQVNVTPECPEWDIPYSPSGEDKMHLTPCWEDIEGGLEYLRPAILFVWTLGLGFVFARATRAVGGSGGGD